MVTVVMPDGSNFSKDDAKIWGNLTPTDGQRRFIDGVRWLRSTPTVDEQSPNVLVLAGYAGSGKTSSIKAVAKMCGEPTVITPTGKAALRVTEATGLPATTIHRWLYFPKDDNGKLKFELRGATQIDIPRNRLVVVDEASMLSKQLWLDIHTVCRTNQLKLILVGDGFQLPPVVGRNEEPFSVMSWRPPEDGIVTRRVELTEVMRQAAGSPVIQAATALREGKAMASFKYVQRLRQDHMADAIQAVLAANGVVIAHRNETRHKINKGIRQLRGFGVDPQPGEPFMVLRNNYAVDVVNGEQIVFGGWEKPPEPFMVADSKTKASKQIHFGLTRVNGAKVVIAVEQLTDETIVPVFEVERAASRWAWQKRYLDLEGKTAPFLHVNFGYAYTAHKAQGSEWPYALVVLEPSINVHKEDGARWAYTAITRASQEAAVYFGSI